MLMLCCSVFSHAGVGIELVRSCLHVHVKHHLSPSGNTSRAVLNSLWIVAHRWMDPVMFLISIKGLSLKTLHFLLSFCCLCCQNVEHLDSILHIFVESNPLCFILQNVFTKMKEKRTVILYDTRAAEWETPWCFFRTPSWIISIEIN